MFLLRGGIGKYGTKVQNLFFFTFAVYVVIAACGVTSMVNYHRQVIICTNCLYVFSSYVGNKPVAYAKGKHLLNVPVLHPLSRTGFLVQIVKMKENKSGLK